MVSLYIIIKIKNKFIYSVNYLFILFENPLFDNL